MTHAACEPVMLPITLGLGPKMETNAFDEKIACCATNYTHVPQRYGVPALTPKEEKTCKYEDANTPCRVLLLIPASKATQQRLPPAFETNKKIWRLPTLLHCP